MLLHRRQAGCEANRCDDEGVEVGVHEASKVDVATSNASFGALVMSPCGHTARSNTESTI